MLRSEYYARQNEFEAMDSEVRVIGSPHLSHPRHVVYRRAGRLRYGRRMAMVYAIHGPKHSFRLPVLRTVTLQATRRS